jgi:hypothetical protein
MIVILAPHKDDFVWKTLRAIEQPPIWVPIEMSMAEMRQRMHDHLPPALATGTGVAAFSMNPAGMQMTGRITFDQVALWNHTYNVPVPAEVLDEQDPKKRNKIARKKREAAKASQNARGRKWWEHR